MDVSKVEYPFGHNFYELNNTKMHYVDEGQGDVVVMVHGNPTWSFYYRNLIKHLSKSFRVIAIDHIGCGLSDKPIDYNYTLEQRINDLTGLLFSLKLSKYSMVVHDWGGAIGFGHAVEHTQNIDKMIILNTAAFLSQEIPFSISLCKNKFFGPFIVKYLNAFCYPATFLSTEKKLSKVVKKAYLAPYSKPKLRQAISEFVQDIPLDKNHGSYDLLKQIESKLTDLSGKKLILWGGKDFCFNDHFFKKWQEIYPEAQYKYYEGAGHYILEDEKEDTLFLIEKFLKD
ncbi:MAG: alpha/beta fold hydrolase [Halobacteriovoraceae bacterium]|nr:alpha/beta fold hydrolase [Halobacteriovoraceae bacterium]